MAGSGGRLSARAFFISAVLFTLLSSAQYKTVYAQSEPSIPSKNDTTSPSTQRPESLDQQQQQQQQQQQIAVPEGPSLVQSPPIADDTTVPDTSLPADRRQSVCQFDPDKGPEMVVLPPGSFRMGSEDKVGDNNERPTHDVTIDYAFALGRCEVTFAEFQLFAESAADALGNVEADECWTYNESRSDYEAIPDVSWADPQLPIVDMRQYPVVCVNIPMVEAYIAWINELTGLEYRLPSEAELEYALRGGGADSSEWLNSDDECRYANMADLSFNQYLGADSTRSSNAVSCDDGFQTLAPVGSYVPNPFGLHDIYGNVWEWTADCWHENYEGAPTDGSAWVENCTVTDRRPLRGGSWDVGPNDLRSADRFRDIADDANFNVGFRLARTLP